MRIISGLYKGRRLKTLDGLSIRPTSDRLRETVFNILAPLIEGARVADLCAGSGAVGIEALSRGADRVFFVEQSPKAAAVISVFLIVSRLLSSMAKNPPSDGSVAPSRRLPVRCDSCGVSAGQKKHRVQVERRPARGPEHPMRTLIIATKNTL